MLAPRILLGLCLAAEIGCAPALRAPNVPEPELHERWLPSFVFGIFCEPALDVRDVCASGAATAVGVGANIGTTAVAIFTLGIYTPRKVWVACAPRAE